MKPIAFHPEARLELIAAGRYYAERSLSVAQRFYAEIWENDLTWKRKNLIETGLMTMKDQDAWEISESGIAVVERWAERVRTLTEQEPEWRKDFDGIAPDGVYLTPTCIEYLVKIVRGGLWDVQPSKPPRIPEALLDEAAAGHCPPPSLFQTSDNAC